MAISSIVFHLTPHSVRWCFAVPELKKNCSDAQQSYHDMITEGRRLIAMMQQKAEETQDRAAEMRQQGREKQAQMRQQAEAMRLHVRVGELLEAASLRNAAAESAATDVACIERELTHAEGLAERLAADLVAQREHASRQEAALHAAREREASAHSGRLAEHQAQLEGLRRMITEEQRVDPRVFVEQLEPVYARLADGLRHEINLSSTLGESWAAAEVEAARQRAAMAEARLAAVEAGKARERDARQQQQHAERVAAHASAQLHVDELKEHVASLLSQLQEGETAARRTEEALLSTQAHERETFHTTLQAIQAQLATARKENVRAARGAHHLVARVMAEWQRRRLGRVVRAWRGVVLTSVRMSLWGRAQTEEERIAAALAAAQRAETAASAKLADAALRDEELKEREAAMGEREAAMARKEVAMWQVGDGARRPHDAQRSPRHSAPRSGRHGTHRRRSAAHHQHSPLDVRARAAAADISPAVGGSAPPLPTKPIVSAEPQRRYLEYLRQCVRQGRAPADEVVEMMRTGWAGTAALGAEAASTLALQIRSAEEQLGLAAAPVPTSTAAAWLPSSLQRPTGASA